MMDCENKRRKLYWRLSEETRELIKLREQLRQTLDDLDPNRTPALYEYKRRDRQLVDDKLQSPEHQDWRRYIEEYSSLVVREIALLKQTVTVFGPQSGFDLIFTVNTPIVDEKAAPPHLRVVPGNEPWWHSEAIPDITDAFLDFLRHTR